MVLAPGQRVTPVDASDPTMHVTAAQVKHAGELVANADGSVSIGAPTDAAPAVDTYLGEGAVLVFDSGRYVGVAAQPPIARVSGTGAISSAGSLGVAAHVKPGTINGQHFNIGAGGSITITQPSASSAVPNRVTGTAPSQIHGTIQLTSPGGISVTTSGAPATTGVTLK